MHKSWVVTWFSLITCSLTEQTLLDAGLFITPCLAGLDIGLNSCKASPSSSDASNSISLSVEDDDDDCLSDDCDASTSNRPTTISGPWTLSPQCISNPSSSRQTFCVYTSASFFHGRGISFFTTPTIAKTLEKIPAIAQEGVFDHFDHKGERPWEVRHVEGRGNGLFATRELKRGDLVLADLPVGVYNSDAITLDYEEDYKHLHVAFDQLPRKTKKLFMGMAQHYEGDEIMERINTNAFHGIFEGAPHFMLYPETARINHACRPNTMSYHDPATLIHATHASRTILVGEEITLTYTDILQSRSGRQKALSTYWGFTCTCSLCSAPHEHTSASDARIAQILTRQAALRDWSPSSAATPKMAEELIRLYSEEQVYSAVATGYVLAALAHNAVGNGAMAKRYAQAAIEAGLVTGPVDVIVEDVKGLTERPEGHWSWRKRVGSA